MGKLNVKELADKCKWFEKNFSLDQMIPELPVIIRFDGNNFSKWTKKLDKPFDLDFVDVMGELTKYLMEETGAKIGFHQSDEISLIIMPGVTGFSYHEGKKQKILSKLTSKCTIKFNELIGEKKTDNLSVAIFDSRIYQVPNKLWAYKQIFWRQLDGIRNSKQMLAHYHLGHSAIMNMGTRAMVEKLELEKGIDWEIIGSTLKYGGLYIQKRVNIPFTPEEISQLPPQHNYFKNPDMLIERNMIERSILDNITRLDIERLEDVFDNQPILPEIKPQIRQLVNSFHNKLDIYKFALKNSPDKVEIKHKDELINDLKFLEVIMPPLGFYLSSGPTEDHANNINTLELFVNTSMTALLY